MRVLLRLLLLTVVFAGIVFLLDWKYGVLSNSAPEEWAGIDQADRLSRQLMRAQEAYYADRTSYTNDLTALDTDIWRLPEGVEVRVRLQSNDSLTGYHALIQHRLSGNTCEVALAPAQLSPAMRDQPGATESVACRSSPPAGG